MEEINDPLFALIKKLNFIIKEYDFDYNKIEIIIKNNELYKQLSINDQLSILEICMEKITELKNKKNDKKKEEEIKPSIPDMKNNLKKSNYTFGKKEVDIIYIEDNDGNLVTEGEALSSTIKAVITEKKGISTKDYKRRAAIFNKVKEIPLPAQRSKEWFEMRNEKITGSDAGCVLSMNKHEAQYNFVLKKVFGSTFEGNYACYHGKVFEEVVTMMYEIENDIKTEEFGLLGHEKINILGASPDGICSPFCLDGKTKSPLVGRMLEIKCPTMRKIKYSGNIIDNICPIYYYCQIQQQMECVDLDECDFIQCNIVRYVSRKEWIEDTHDEYDYKSKKHNLYRGIVIELVPTKLEEDDYENGRIKDLTIWNKGTFLYPPKIEMSHKELEEWILETLDNLDDNVQMHKIIYWKLLEKNCTLIKRDKDWFKKQLPIYEKIWYYVLYLRLNLNVANEWKEWVNTQPRKYNDKILKKLDLLIKCNNDKYINNYDSSKDYYKILDINKDANESEIHSAYFELGKYWLDEDNIKKSKKNKKEIEKVLNNLLEAYSILLNKIINQTNQII